jgi:hypothetical protein
MPASLTEHTLGQIIAENQELALHNHQHFNESGCFAVNLTDAELKIGSTG